MHNKPSYANEEKRDGARHYREGERQEVIMMMQYKGPGGNVYN